MTLALTDQATPTPTPARRRAPAPTDPRRRRLPRPLHRAVLMTHVLTSVGWFGVAITVAFLGFIGSRDADLAYYDMIRSTLWLSIPLGLASAATGVVLSVTTRWGLTRYWWVVIKEAITIAAIATDVLVVGPEIAAAVDSGTASAMPGPIYAHCVVLAIATGLSVIKPKARTRRSETTNALVS